jgi:hypothetical protein
VGRPDYAISEATMLASLFMATVLATWPAPLRQAAQAEKSPSEISFSLSTQADGDKVVTLYDPAAIEEKRWEVTYPTGRKLTKNERDLFTNLKRTRPKDLFCATRLDSIPASVTLKSQNKTMIVYSYKPTPNEKTNKQVAAIMKDATAEIRISKKTKRIIGGRMATKSEFSPAPLVTVTSYDETYECGPGVAGATLTTWSVMNIEAAALGKTRHIVRDVKVSEVRAAP